MAKNDLQTKIDRLNAAAEIIEKEHKPKRCRYLLSSKSLQVLIVLNPVTGASLNFLAWMLVDLAQDILMWIRRGDIC